MTSSPATWAEEAFRTAIQSSLDGFVGEQGRRLEPLGPDVLRLVAGARRAVSGGKRLRAAFCYWGFRAVQASVEDEEPLLRAAAALELLHASALVHDDYIDASQVRRGRAASHVSFAAEHRDQGWAGNAGQYGAAGAILLGDLLLAWSDRRLRTCGLDDSVVREALEVFDVTRSEMITGQFLDVSTQFRGDTGLETAMLVLRYKSAKYSVEQPLQIGATLAGAGGQVRAALSAFGLPVGEAFQLRDDLLGVFGDPEVTGKPAGDDLREGKRTVLVAHALATASAQDAAVLDAALSRSRVAAPDEDEVRALQRLIDGTGAAAAVEKTIEDLTGQALAALEAAPVTDTARECLAELTLRATQRVR